MLLLYEAWIDLCSLAYNYSLFQTTVALLSVDYWRMHPVACQKGLKPCIDFCDKACWQAINRLTPSFLGDTGYSLVG